MHSHPEVPLYTVVPFVLLLAGIAILPLAASTFWDRNRNKGLFAAVLAAPIGLWLLGWNPALLAHTASDYFSFLCLLGSLFVVLALACYREREGEKAARAAKDLFAYSVLYLFLLFTVLLVEQGFNIHVGAVPHIWTS